MFDDSKRLDALESQMKQTITAREFDRATEAGFKQVNENTKVFEKQFAELRAELKQLTGEIKSLKDVNTRQSARIAKLEADMKKK